MVARIYEIRKRGKRKKIILMYERREQAKMPVLFLCAARGAEDNCCAVAIARGNANSGIPVYGIEIKKNMSNKVLIKFLT